MDCPGSTSSIGLRSSSLICRAYLAPQPWGIPDRRVGALPGTRLVTLFARLERIGRVVPTSQVLHCPVLVNSEGSTADHTRVRASAEDVFIGNEIVKIQPGQLPGLLSGVGFWKLAILPLGRSDPSGPAEALLTLRADLGCVRDVALNHVVETMCRHVSHNTGWVGSGELAPEVELHQDGCTDGTDDDQGDDRLDQLQRNT